MPYSFGKSREVILQHRTNRERREDLFGATLKKLSKPSKKFEKQPILSFPENAALLVFIFILLMSKLSFNIFLTDTGHAAPKTALKGRAI